MPNTSENGSTKTLISPAYQAQQQTLHETSPYGTASILYAPIVSAIIEKMQITHLLDYGCGANTQLPKHLKVSHKLTYQAYDPGVPRYSTPPLPAELVACIDVLEHIEPEYLDLVFDDLARLAEGVLFASVTTCAAFKSLPDGRNAHLTQQPMSWWLPKFWDRWEIQTVQAISAESFFVVGTTKPRIEGLDGRAIV